MANDDTAYAISNKQFSNYFVFFHEIVPTGQYYISGSRAREFFLLSNLPPETLSHIWKLSDIDKDGQLNVIEFSLALHLTQLCLNSVPLPSSLPPILTSFVHEVTHPQEYMSPAKTNQVLKCQSAFLSFCENISNSGYLTAEAARYLLTNSQLSKAHLFHIWKLADGDKDGRLSFQEFVVAMHLIFVAKLDQPLPCNLDNIDLFPDEFNSIVKKVSALVSEKPSNDHQTTPLPLVPNFAIPTDHPFINPLFKRIPGEKFRNEKFDVFIGDPFIDKMNGDHKLSGSSSSLHSTPPPPPRLSHSESAEISKLPSSHHSSVKSLVEERDEPKMMKAESIELEENKQFVSSPPPPLTPKSPLTSNKEDTPPAPPTRNTPPTPPTRKTPPTPPTRNTPPSSTTRDTPPSPPIRNTPPTPPTRFNNPNIPPPQLINKAPPTQANDEDTPPPLPPPPQPSDLLSSDEEEIDEEVTKAELDKISQESNKFLSQTGGDSSNSHREPYKDPYANAPEMKTASQKGLTATIQDIVPDTQTTPTSDMPAKKTTPPTTSEATSKNNNGLALDFLAQLEDLEAEIMNVLDDTNSFDPMAAPPISPPTTKPSQPLPTITTKPPIPPNRDETDAPPTRKLSGGKGASKKDPSPILLRGDRKGSARLSSSDSSSTEPSPAPRRYTVASSPVRKKMVQNNANRNSALLDDLDDIFSAELASIDTFLETKQNQEKQTEERIRRETMDVKRMEKKALETPELPRPTVMSIEELTRRRQEESERKQREWEEELKKIEEEAQKQYEEQRKVKLSDEEAVKGLEAEWEELLEQESKNMKEAWVIRAQREKEDQRRREELKKRMMEQKKELTIEEWIKMMEENKMKEMTPEERQKYEQRKKEWLEKRRQKEEKHRREMEEKLQRNRERMAAEYLRVRNIEEEVKQNRLESEQLKQNEEEILKREAEERRQRSQSAKIKKEENRLKEIEENKPKARSALAARWESQVKGRDSKDFRSTVLTGSPIKDTTSRTKEADRLARRVGKLS